MAGGEGSRLRPLTIGRPKPMVPIVNKSVISHILDLLAGYEITEVVITLRYMASAIQDFLGTDIHRGMKISYSIEESPLGTAGSVKHAAKYLGDDPFLVISGDALTDFNLSAITGAHKESGADATIALARVPTPLEFGVVITDEAGWVTQFLEKPSWGEVISDTVNTGIYVLPPEVLDLIPDNVMFDFSHDLFPKMLEKGKKIAGYVSDGYWCDVGNIEEYIRANSDLLQGRVKAMKPIGHHIGGEIYVGRDVEIAPSAQLFGPIYLGNEVKIKGDVVIHGPAVIRDYTVVDNYTRIERSVLWRNNYVGESSELRGAIIARQCSLKSNVHCFEGAVIGDGCILGEGAVIQSQVKLWPGKEIEAGATVNESIIWGNQGRRSLFSRYGVSGIVNIDLTSEFAAKLGAALGALLPKNSYVAINRDANRASRMIKRALISGLPGSGVNVLDLGTVAIPVVRYFVRSHEDVAAGVHVRLSPFDQRVLDIRFIDEQGLNLSTPSERQIERIYFREDFRRAYFNEIGAISYARDVVESYAQAFLDSIDQERIRARRFKIVVDYSHGLASEILSDIFTDLNVEVLMLNARMDEHKLAVLEEEFDANRVSMGKIVSVLEADLGIQFDVGGEKIFLVDNKGRILEDETAAALITELALRTDQDRGRTIAVPINASSIFDTIADWYEGHILRIRRNFHSLTSASGSPDVVMVADGSGNFIFPDFHPAIDGMFAAARLLEYLSLQNTSVADIVDYLPQVYTAKSQVHCPWQIKGTVMRRINERYADADVEKIDGLKIHFDGSKWVHILPNPEKPLCELFAEASNQAEADQLIEEFQAIVQEIVDNRA
ncbi:MAG: NTP transferase domain-containing protein [Caldilineaceae bacterium]|nr:NTP transferase domain-containing protein [Caldilineaceae bacterium]